MRNYLLLLILVAMTSFKINLNAQVDYMLITGTIKNASVDYVRLGKFHQIPIENGSFSDTLRFRKPGEHYLFTDNVLENVPFYFKPGLNLNISFDQKDFKKTLVVSGSGKIYVNCIKKLDELDSSYLAQKKMLSLTEANFIVASSEIFKRKNEFLNEHLYLDTEFINLKKEDNHFSHIRRLLDYWKKNKLKHLTLIQSELKAFNFPDNNKLKDGNRLYIYYVKEYLNILSEQYKQERKINIYDAYAETIWSLNLTSELKEKLLKDYFLKFFGLSPYQESLSLIDLEQVRNAYHRISENDKNIEVVNNSFNKIKALQKGMPAPNFSLRDVDGRMVSLSDFKGKYVFINVWATWCAGCVVDMPNFKKLMERYKHKNMISLKITLDRNESVWKKFIARENLKGLNLLADKKFIDDYFIQTISRYILIDPEGKIVTVNAPLPSSKEINDLLYGI